MMGNVKHIHGDEIVNQNGVNELAKEALASTAELVDSGEVAGVIIIRQHADGSTTNLSGGFLYNTRIVGELMKQVVSLSNG